MKRTALLRKQPISHTETAAKGYGKCKFCRAKLVEAGKRLHDACIDPWIAREVAKQQKAQRKVARAETKVRKDATARINDLHAAAQRSFNSWVRMRDAKEPCISCGASPPDTQDLHAGRDAGHFRSVGSASHLRYTEDNVSAQCVACNQWGAGKAVDYRRGLVERIGLARVEALETDYRVKKWTREELIAIRDTYRAKLKALKKDRQ